MTQPTAPNADAVGCVSMQVPAHSPDGAASVGGFEGAGPRGNPARAPRSAGSAPAACITTDCALWGHLPDGRLWAIMCPACSVLGGHEPDCGAAPGVAACICRPGDELHAPVQPADCPRHGA